jgi:hypothetical protein
VGDNRGSGEGSDKEVFEHREKKSTRKKRLGLGDVGRLSSTARKSEEIDESSADLEQM